MLKCGKIVEVRQATLLLMLQGRRPLLALPPDAELVGVQVSGDRVRLKIHSDAFPAIPEGQSYPVETVG